MSVLEPGEIGLNIGALREAIREEYDLVARESAHGFHFHTGRPLAHLLAYDDVWLDGIPEPTIASFAGTGNPFRLGILQPGEHVVDGGAGLDSLIASRMVGPEGHVIGVDMTPAMVARGRQSIAALSQRNIKFREGYAEVLPIPDGWADVVISNGVLNLMPDKPGGRLQIGDILVQKAVPASAKRKIDL